MEGMKLESNRTKYHVLESILHLQHRDDSENGGLIGSGCGSVSKSCPTLYNPMNCSPLGSSVHEILQARVLVWIAISFSRGFSQLRDQTPIQNKKFKVVLFFSNQKHGKK